MTSSLKNVMFFFTLTSTIRLKDGVISHRVKILYTVPVVFAWFTALVGDNKT